MTPPIRTDTDRLRVAQNTAATADWLSKAPHTAGHLRAAIEARIPDGLGAASYDGKVNGGAPVSVQERNLRHRPGCVDDDTCRCPDPKGDAACDDLATLDRALRQWAEATDLLYGLTQRYPIYDATARKGLGDREPGKGKAPKEACAVCWMHGLYVVREGDYALWCNTCARFTKKHGERPLAKALWEILHRRGYVNTRDLREHAPHLVPKDERVAG